MILVGLGLRAQEVTLVEGGWVGQISISEKISMRCKCKSTPHQVINLQIKYSSQIIQLFKVSHECTMRVGVVSCPPYLAHFLVHLHFDMIKPIPSTTCNCLLSTLLANFSNTYLLFNFCSKLRGKNCQGLLVKLEAGNNELMDHALVCFQLLLKLE